MHARVLLFTLLAACRIDAGELPARTVHVAADYNGSHAELDASFPAVDFGDFDARCEGDGYRSSHDCDTTMSTTAAIDANATVAAVIFSGSTDEDYGYFVYMPRAAEDAGDPADGSQVWFDGQAMVVGQPQHANLGQVVPCLYTALACSVVVTPAP